MNNQQHTGRLRVTGGIILGEKSLRPMAFADEESSFQFRNNTVQYKARSCQIIGLPRYDSAASQWVVGPVLGRYIDALAPEWRGTIPEGGCEFYLYEEYYPDLIFTGAVFVRSGKLVAVTGPEIVQRDWNYVVTENQSYSYDSGTGAITQNAIVMTRISVVYEQDGVYYFRNTGTSAPDDPDPNYSSYSFPADFDTINTL